MKQYDELSNGCPVFMINQEPWVMLRVDDSSPCEECEFECRGKPISEYPCWSKSSGCTANVTFRKLEDFEVDEVLEMISTEFPSGFDRIMEWVLSHI